MYLYFVNQNLCFKGQYVANTRWSGPSLAQLQVAFC